MARSNIKYTKQHRVLANEFIEVSSGFVTTNLPFTADTNYKVKVASITEGGSNISYNKSTGAFACGEIMEGLPSGYTQIEYVQATGAQRIKIGLTPKGNYTIEMDFAVTDTSITSALWCARGSTTSTTTMTAFYIANTGLRCDYNTDSSNGNIGAVTANTRHILKIVNGKYYLDGTLKKEYTANSFTAGSALELFASHYNGIDSNIGNYAKIKMYDFKMMDENGLIVSHLIPAKNSSNTAGVYDVARGTFYSSATSTGMTAGSDY